MEEEGIRVGEAVTKIVMQWEVTGKRPRIDAIRETMSKPKLGILKPRMKECLNHVAANQWRKVRFCVDSGAGETVMTEDELPEVDTKESWGNKHGQSYEVANGDEIDNKGGKEVYSTYDDDGRRRQRRKNNHRTGV